MGFRSASETREPGPDQRDRDAGGSQQRHGQSASDGEQFGITIHRDGLELKLQRLVDDHGADQVRQWADEGMPVETMGKPRDMASFRDRQRERPSEVPTDIERRNAMSVQRSRGAHLDAPKAGSGGVPDSVRDVVASPGRPLDSEIQTAMEERMGDSLGDVRIHTGPRAASACEAINARAFTVGNHVAFNHGEYDPETAEGQHVLAHELAHVRQQTGGAVSMLPQKGQLEIDPDERLEREAEETAQRVMQGGELGVYRMATTDIHVQRIAPDDADGADGRRLGDGVALGSGLGELTDDQRRLVERFLALEELTSEELRTVAGIFDISDVGEVETGLDRLGWIRENHEEVTAVTAGWEANQEDRYPDWFEDPHDPDSLVLSFTTHSEGETTMLRAHGEENQQGFWLIPPASAGGVDPEDATELTAEQLEAGLALPEAPKYLSTVSLPPGTPIRISSIAANFGGEGHWTQAELEQVLDEDAYERLTTLQGTEK